MSRFQHSQLRLNIINKVKQDYKISVIVGGSLTISHLKRKIQTEFDELYSREVVVKLIEDQRGFIVSNNSTVGEHFRSGDTVYFTEHDHNEKSTGFSMNMPTNMGEIISTVKFMTGSALQKLDKIDLSSFNVMEVVPEFLHLGFWYSNDSVVGKVYKMFNKIFGQESIERFVCSCSEVQMSLLVKNYVFWLVEIPSATFTHHEIVWQLLQLLEKMSENQKFGKVIKAVGNSSGNKILKSVSDIAKDANIAGEFKKIAQKIVKNLNGGRSGSSGMGKVKSAYIPSMLGSSSVGSYDLEDILNNLSSGSPEDKLLVLQQIATGTNFEAITQASVRSDNYERLVLNLFTIRKLKNRKLITFFNQALNKVLANSSKDHCISIMQKDILKRVHSFMLEAPVETHGPSLELLGKICRVSSSVGMFNIQKSVEFLNSPYPEFQILMSQCLAKMSEQLQNVSSVRFIPGIKDSIRLCLKTNDENISFNILKMLSNLCLDEQCRYQILSLKGVQIFIKFLETANTNTQICKTASKGLLNLTISSRDNKAKVLSLMNNVLEKFYDAKYDIVTNGYIETILKSRNI